MKKTLDIKKLILLNMPYILLGLFATNFGEAWRMAQGADASEKFLSLVAVLPGTLQSFWPSLHPLDLLVGLCCGVGLRLAVYLKSKNTKKYERMMTRRPEGGKETSRPPSLSHSHPCYGCGNYGRPCVGICHREMSRWLKERRNHHGST